jgi:hypothetical protein
MPPVSGLLQPTLVRLALEKVVPANGPAEKISGFSGASGSTPASPHLHQRLGDQIASGQHNLFAVQFACRRRPAGKIDLVIGAHGRFSRL